MYVNFKGAKNQHQLFQTKNGTKWSCAHSLFVCLYDEKKRRDGKICCQQMWMWFYLISSKTNISSLFEQKNNENKFQLHIEFEMSFTAWHSHKYYTISWWFNYTEYLTNASLTRTQRQMFEEQNSKNLDANGQLAGLWSECMHRCYLHKAHGSTLDVIEFYAHWKCVKIMLSLKSHEIEFSIIRKQITNKAKC